MNIRIIAFTSRGMEVGKRIQRGLIAEGYTDRDRSDVSRGGHDVNTDEWVAESFFTNEALIFVGACGIAVRSIASHISDKASDPAVIVVDELGRNIIPILSGHLGGANDLARNIAAFLGGSAIITTATDTNGVFAIDEWAKNKGYAISDISLIKNFSAKLLANEVAALSSSFEIAEPPFRARADHDEPDIWITYRDVGTRVLRIIPPAIAVGIGCRRGMKAEDIEKAYLSFLQENNIDRRAVARAATIDIKEDEPGLLEFCKRYNLELCTFTADELNGLCGDFSSSDFVKDTTGTDNVCERSAVLASDGGRLIIQKTSYSGITLAMAVYDIKIDWSIRIK